MKGFFLNYYFHFLGYSNLILHMEASASECVQNTLRKKFDPKTYLKRREVTPDKWCLCLNAQAGQIHCS